jgi:hypothetical protein
MKRSDSFKFYLRIKIAAFAQVARKKQNKGFVAAQLNELLVASLVIK